MADVGIKISATDATKPAFDSVSRGLGTIQSSAASVAGALAGLGIGISVGGFVAMTKAIVDGLDAMNDLKDATGASIENISALEDVARRSGASFDTVSTALIKLNQGLNAAKPGSDTEAAIKAIGLSVKDLKALDPAEAFRQVAVAMSGFSDDANKARLTQELFGKSLKEVAPLLKDLAESGQLNGTVTAAQAEAAEKLNKQMFSLQKNVLDVGRALTSALIPALADGVERFLLAQKYAGGLLNTLYLYSRLDYGKNIQGNLEDVEKEIARLEERATRITSAGAKTGNDKLIADERAKAAYLKELRQTKILADQGDNSDAVSRRFIRNKPTVGEFDQSAAKAAAAASAKALADQNRELEKEQALLATLSGFNADYEEQMARLGRIREKGNISLTEYVQLVTELNAKQPAIKAAADAEAKAAEVIDKANKAAFESRLKYVNSLSEGVGKLQLETQAQQEYIDRLGLSKEAIAALDAAKLESQAVILDLIAIKELDKNLDEEQFELYKKQSAELRKQAALKMQGSVKEAQLEIEKEITAERKRGWEETDRIARDVFVTWATDGSNAAQKIGDTLKKALLSAIYEATLKPVVFQLYSSIAGGGGAGAALQAAGGGGGGNILSGLSNVFGNAAGLFGAGFKAGFGSVFGEAGTLGGLSAGTTAIGAGNLAGGLGTLAGTAAPLIAGLALLKSLTDYKVESRGSGLTATLGGASGLPSGSVGMFNEFQQTGGLGGGGTTINRDWSVADAGVANYIAKNVQQITASNRAYADALGLSSESIDSFTKNIEVSLTGLDAAGQQAAINAALSTFAAEQAAATYGDAVAQYARDGETTAQTLQRLGTDLTGTNAVLDSFGLELYSVSAAGASAASSMLQASGGLQNFQAQLTATYAQLSSAQQDLADANRSAYDLAAEAESQASGFGAGVGSSSGGGSSGGGDNGLAEAIDYLAATQTNIRQWLDRLGSTDEGGQSVEAQRTNAWAALQAQMVLARGGDRTALDGITGYADSYIGTINQTSATSEEARLAIGRVRGQIAALPGQVSAEQFIVNAINANGGSGGSVATAVRSLGSKLTAELTVSARSEIVKLIEFVADTDKLPPDLKRLALASTDIMTKTVSFVTGSRLTEENKQLALGTSSLLTKTINYTLGLDIPDEYKRLALKASDSINRTITFTARNVLDPEQAELVLMTDNSIVKTIEVAADFLDANALTIAYAQSEIIRKTIEASGGVLTADQEMLLNNITAYNKQVNLIVNLDEGALNAAENFLQTRFNTLDIQTVITANNGMDVLRDFVKSQLASGPEGFAVANVYQASRQYGFTQGDIANAMGVSVSEVQSIFQKYGIPAFAAGGYYGGGMALVGEKGPELINFSQPGQVYTADQTANLMRGGQSQEVLVDEIRALRNDNQAQARSLVQLQQRMNKLLERWDGNGMPETRVVA